MREKPFADYPDIVNIDQLREMLGGRWLQSSLPLAA